MSSGSSGRYQSKLFSFVDQRSRRLTNQLKLIFHNIQVAAKAKTEVLLSPLFHLWNRDGSSRNLLPSQTNTGITVKPEISLIFIPLNFFRSVLEKVAHRLPVINDLFRLAINQKPLIDLHQELESKFIPSVQSKKLLKIERSPSPDLIDHDWLTWNDLFDQIKEPQHSHEIKAQPDWIEINARFLGYEQHPLERVLAWLDKILLALEKTLQNGCFFFRGLFGG